MDRLDKIIERMKANPRNVRFTDICKICEHYFGKPRVNGSHHMYKTPWQGDPRINVQDDNGKAKPYQVQQVLKAIKIIMGISKEGEGGNG
jgi:hypothetical protein